MSTINAIVTSASEGTHLLESTPYLHERNGQYYFKRKVPAKIVRLLNWPLQVWKSLDTSDIGVAIPRCRRENLMFEQAMNDAVFNIDDKSRLVLARAPRGEGTTKYLLQEHIPFLLKRYAYAQHLTADEERKNASLHELEEQRSFVADFLAVRKMQSKSMNYAEMEDTAVELLMVERLIAPPGSHARRLLLQELLAEDIRVLQEQLRRLDGEPFCPIEVEPIAPRAMQTMLDAFHDWRKKRAPAVLLGDLDKVTPQAAGGQKLESVTLRTVDAYQSFVEEFEGVCGALPTAAITLAIAGKYRNHLAKQGLLRETVKNRVGALAAILRVANCKQEQVKNRTDKNVFDFVDLEMVPERQDSELRRAYETSELQHLFSSRIYTQGQCTWGQARESAYWAPLLGPFVGARIEEIAQIRVEDVKRIQGVWTLRVVDLGPDQNLKNSSSYRLVPLHAEVIRCGFLAYIAAQKMAGHQRAFPSQRNDNKYGRWSNALGKWYSAYLDSIGLDDPRLCYQSFRYSFKQQNTICGAQEEVRDALAGHWLTKEMQKSSRNYLRREDKQYPFESLVEAIEGLSYEGLDLSHLYVENPFLGVEVLQTRSQSDFVKGSKVSLRQFAEQ